MAKYDWSRKIPWHGVGFHSRRLSHCVNLAGCPAASCRKVNDQTCLQRQPLTLRECTPVRVHLDVWLRRHIMMRSASSYLQCQIRLDEAPNRFPIPVPSQQIRIVCCLPLCGAAAENATTMSLVITIVHCDCSSKSLASPRELHGRLDSRKSLRSSFDEC